MNCARSRSLEAGPGDGGRGRGGLDEGRLVDLGEQHHQLGQLDVAAPGVEQQVGVGQHYLLLLPALKTTHNRNASQWKLKGVNVSGMLTDG